MFSDYLLDLLQQAFFAAKLNRRRRRDSVQRPAHVSDSVSASRRVNNDRSPSITSVIMKPTFERSLMTMSFLMFGVFVIRVMQVINARRIHADIFNGLIPILPIPFYKQLTLITILLVKLLEIILGFVRKTSTSRSTLKCL